MPTAINKTLSNLIAKDHHKYYKITQFFLDPTISKSSKELKSLHFLESEIESLNSNDFEFPSKIEHIAEWINEQNKMQCKLYAEYLDRRKIGGGREFFTTLSKVYEFIYKIAPIKRVDGSWLYSFTQYWNDPVFRDFIQIYLEELGLGNQKRNHVTIFNNLFISLGLHQFSINLSDEYYHQPSIQLALAYATSNYIPEIAGFNLGYEQLPLHLLITNYELKELGIDSKYFNLHITIDNFENGHGKLAAYATEKLAKKYKSKDEYMRKLKLGFLLNNKGISSNQIIKKLCTEQIVHQIFKKKALVGKHMHNGKCKFNNMSVNEWLSDDEKVEDFIFELIKMNWLKLNENPERSRFWKLINDENEKMFGVFTSAEKIFIYDWIAGNQVVWHRKSVNSEFIDNFIDLKDFSYLVDHELLEIQRQTQGSINTAHKISKLMPYLAPHLHHQEIGLWSTQRITEYLFPFLCNDL